MSKGDWTWVLVPCPGSRADELKGLLSTLRHPIERTVVVTTTQDRMPHWAVREWTNTLVVCQWEGRHHISRWWNRGLHNIAGQMRAAAPAGTPHEVLVCSSDIQASPVSITCLRDALRSRDLSMVGPDLNSRLSPGQIETYGPTHTRTVFERLSGHVFMLAGEQGLRADERYRWWYSDDDLEMQARHRRGAGLVGGTGMTHPADHHLGAQQHRDSVEDRTLYISKWGTKPW